MNDFLNKIKNLLGICLGVCLLFAWQDRVLLNTSESMPRGIWRVHELHDEARFVSLTPPEEALRWGCTRPDQLLIKEVWATQGDHVCLKGRVLYREDEPGREIHTALYSRGGDVLELGWKQGCRRLGEGEVFVLGHHPSSCDSRFFGPVPTSSLQGAVSPWVLWDDMDEEMP